MSEKQKFHLARLMMGGGVFVAVVWGVASVLSLFDVVERTTQWYRVVSGIGPLGMAVFAMGGLLCRWDLRGMRERIQAEE